MSTEIKILQNVICISDRCFLMSDIRSLRRTTSDGQAIVRFHDKDQDSGWFSCTQEDFVSIANAWDNYLEKEKQTHSLKQVKSTKL